MPTAQNAHSAIRVSDSLRELLRSMNFPEIPEEANYIAFFDDGEACFLEEIAQEGMIPQIPRMLFVSTSLYKDVKVQLDD